MQRKRSERSGGHDDIPVDQPRDSVVLALDDDRSRAAGARVHNEMSTSHYTSDDLIIAGLVPGATGRLTHSLWPRRGPQGTLDTFKL